MKHTSGHIDCPACEATWRRIISEEQPHTYRDGLGESLQGVTLAAKIFSNYVFVPPRGTPDGDPGASGMHGAAILVFGDESAEQVQLRTGYASHAVRDAILDTRENISDELVSSHIDLRKDMEMTTTEAVAAKPRKHTWVAGALVIGLLAVVGVSMQQSSNAREQAERDRTALAETLNSPNLTAAEFQAHCGIARHIRQTKQGTELNYQGTPGFTDRDGTWMFSNFVTFTPHGPNFEVENTQMEGAKVHTYRIHIEPAKFMASLNCK